MSRYRTIKLRSGAIVQAGMNATARDYYDQTIPRNAPYRAIVINSFVEDSDGRATSRRRAKVLCDVILVSSQIILQRVQVEQRLGINSGDVWVPRASTRRVSTGGAVELQRRSRRGSPDQDPTPFDDLDGDMVLIDFIEADLDYPIIRGALEHERTKRAIVEGDGWDEANGGSERGSAHKNERYVRWGGAEFRINAQGDILLDTVGATADIIDETVNDEGGEFRIRLKEARRLTVEMDGTDVFEVWKDGSQVRIDLGEGATERIMLGDAFKTFFDGEMTKINTFWSTIYDLHVHPDPATGNTGPPNLLQAPTTISSMPDSTLSDLAKTKKS